MRRQQGFTLVEVLVSLMVMALMAAMAWQGVDSLVRAKAVTQQNLERTLRVNTVLGQWEQDLASLYESRVVPTLQLQGTTLRLTRRVDGGVSVVAWALRGNTWWRWAGPAYTTAKDLQDNWFSSQQLIGGESGQVRMLDDALQWQVYFFRGNGWSNAQSSDDVVAGTAAPGTQSSTRQALPSGVRLVMTFGRDDSTVELTRDVALAPQMP